MTAADSGRCGHVWPTNHHVSDDPRQQHCCYRETLPDADSCVWHADARNSEYKTADRLLSALTSIERESPDVESVTKVEQRVALLDGADLSGLDIGSKLPLAGVSLRDANLQDCNLNTADLSYVDFRGSDLRNATIRDATLTGAVLSRADLSNAALSRSDLSGSVLLYTTLTDASLLEANLSGVYGFSDTNLRRTNLAGAILEGAGLSGADMEGADLPEADLTDANLHRANLTDTNLIDATLTGANIEAALLVRANLFGTNLANCRCYAATFSDAQIDHQTTFVPEEREEDNRGWWPNSSTQQQMRCAYETEGRPLDLDSLNKAAGVYQSFERLARDNAQPTLQSQMFLRRQDVQRRQYRERREYLNYVFSRASKALFNHGESFARVTIWSCGVILLFAFVYLAGGWVRPVEADGTLGDPLTLTQAIGNPQVVWESIYYSTLTFTALGFGDFRPSETLGQMFTVLETSMGALLLALLVFVLGRRAAR